MFTLLRAGFTLRGAFDTFVLTLWKDETAEGKSHFAATHLTRTARI